MTNMERKMRRWSFCMSFAFMVSAGLVVGLLREIVDELLSEK